MTQCHTGIEMFDEIDAAVPDVGHLGRQLQEQPTATDMTAVMPVFRPSRPGEHDSAHNITAGHYCTIQDERGG